MKLKIHLITNMAPFGFQQNLHTTWHAFHEVSALFLKLFIVVPNKEFNLYGFYDFPQVFNRNHVGILTDSPVIRLAN